MKLLLLALLCWFAWSVARRIGARLRGDVAPRSLPIDLLLSAGLLSLLLLGAAFGCWRRRAHPGPVKAGEAIQAATAL